MTDGPKDKESIMMKSISKSKAFWKSIDNESSAEHENITNEIIRFGSETDWQNDRADVDKRVLFDKEQAKLEKLRKGKAEREKLEPMINKIEEK